MLSAARRAVAAMREAQATPAAAGAAAVCSALPRRRCLRPPTEIAVAGRRRAPPRPVHALRALQCTRRRPCSARGREDAALMIVGEQPGDQEDLAGRPFVGPAGQVLRRGAWRGRASTAARPGSPTPSSISSSTPRGKRRLHQNPERRRDRSACRWWLELERALRAAAADRRHGGDGGVRADRPLAPSLTERRGKVEETATGPVLLTWHPSFILRVPDEGRKAEARAQLAEDLTTARELLTA